MKKIILSLSAALFLLAAQAQDSTKAWKAGGAGALTLSQSSSVNWAAGNQNSLSANVLVNLFANYKKGRTTFDNTFDIGYGTLKQGDLPFRKSDDKIELNSKFGYGLKNIDNWYASALFSFRSQMDQGYSYNKTQDTVKLISDLLSPAAMILALGFDYKPSDKFTLFASPLTAKGTFVLNDSLSRAKAFGVDSAKHFRGEFGGFVKIAYKTDLMENVGFQTKIDLFSNYLQRPERVDINWEVLLLMKINKYLSASINTQLIYDYDVKIADVKGVAKDRVQFKEVFGLGFSYNFTNK